MNVKRLVVVLAAGVFCLGLFSGAAAAKKKKKNTVVVVNIGSVLNGKQHVQVSGSLNTASACKPARAMSLLLTDASGVVVGTVDSSSTDGNGNWSLQGNLAAPPTANDRLQVKAGKRTVNKNVCKTGYSSLITIS